MPSPLISSVQNERVKAAAKLRDRKGREQQGRFLIDGPREISLAIAAGVKLVEVFVLENQADELAAEVTAWLERGISLVTVTSAVMEKIAYGERRETAVAVAVPPASDLPSLSQVLLQRHKSTPHSHTLFVVLEGIEKPGNLGAILRTADATGVSAVLVADGGTDLFNPNVVRASRGAIFTVPIAAATSAECLAWLREQRCQLFAARVDGAQDYSASDFRPAAALILGSEADGLTKHWHAADITPIRLPLLGTVDSLNLSVTTAVLCYEALRQRSSLASGKK